MFYSAVHALTKCFKMLYLSVKIKKKKKRKIMIIYNEMADGQNVIKMF